jgi:hypothetical protein
LKLEQITSSLKSRAELGISIPTRILTPIIWQKMLTKDEPEKWQLDLKNERIMWRTNLSCKRIVSGSVKLKQQQFSDCFPLQKSTNPETINCSPKCWVWWYNLQNAIMRKYYAACKIHTFRASAHNIRVGFVFKKSKSN